MEQIEELEKKISEKKKSFEIFQENQQPRLSLLMSRVEKLENSILRYSANKKREEKQLSHKKAFQNMTMPSEISKASESCFFSRISNSPQNKNSMLRELQEEPEQDVKIFEEIQGIQKLVKFYFERVKEGCWLTEDLQTLILERLQKCQNLAEKQKKQKMETPCKDSLFEEREEEVRTFSKVTLGRKRSPIEEFSAACSSFHLDSKRQKHQN